MSPAIISREQAKEAEGNQSIMAPDVTDRFVESLILPVTKQYPRRSVTEPAVG